MLVVIYSLSPQGLSGEVMVSRTYTYGVRVTSEGNMRCKCRYFVFFVFWFCCFVGCFVGWVTYLLGVSVRNLLIEVVFNPCRYCKEHGMPCWHTVALLDEAYKRTHDPLWDLRDSKWLVFEVSLYLSNILHCLPFFSIFIWNDLLGNDFVGE